MRRRSRLEENLANSGRSSTRQYLFYGTIGLLSLALPAALALFGHRFLPSNAPADSGATPYSVIDPTRSQDDTQRQPHPGPGRAVPADLRAGAVPPQVVWRGIASGIASRPESVHDIHVVFSTDCSPYQNYQSILLFQSAEMVGQRGPITRVASGCTTEEETVLQELMDKQPERFRVHFTPDFSLDPVTGEQFLFYNKPNGIAHFLKNADPPLSEAVLALVDPDMIFMSPLTPRVDDPNKMLWHEQEQQTGPAWVVEGTPVGQFYGLGGTWTTWKDLPEITRPLGNDSPALKVTLVDARDNYTVGPPYLMHPRDWARVLDLWVALSPKVYKGHAGILAEMYAFCIAAAHLGLRHRVAYGLMVSDTKMVTHEGWSMVDGLGTDSCNATVVDGHRGSLPPIVHYCQMYRVGTFMWGKRHKSHHNFFSCDSDSLELPPPGYLKSPMGTIRVHPVPRAVPGEPPSNMESVSLETGVRQTYALCAVLRAMNEALAAYKGRYCRPGEVSGGSRRFTDLSKKQVEADPYS
ncbi:unnamed protein product [Pylaiella littoralis]